MQTRIVQMGAAIAAVVLVLTVARTQAFAASDHEKCSTTDTDVENLNATDGTEASCQAEATKQGDGPRRDQRPRVFSDGRAAPRPPVSRREYLRRTPKQIAARPTRRPARTAPPMRSLPQPAEAKPLRSPATTLSPKRRLKAQTAATQSRPRTMTLLQGPS